MEHLDLSNPLRIKVLTSIPSPYQVDLFNAVDRQSGVRLSVLYWRDSTCHPFDLKPGRGQITMKGFLRGNARLCPRILSEVRDEEYDVFVVCGMSATALVAICLLRLTHRNCLFWGERLHPSEPNSFKGRAKRALWRWIGRWSKGVLAIGSLAVLNYEQYGVPRDHILDVPYAPDLSVLLSPSSEIAAAGRLVREEAGATKNTTVFLFVGMLIRRKGASY